MSRDPDRAAALDDEGAGAADVGGRGRLLVPTLLVMVGLALVVLGLDVPTPWARGGASGAFNACGSESLDASVASNLATLQQALEMYAVQHRGRLPDDPARQLTTVTFPDGQPATPDFPCGPVVRYGSYGLCVPYPLPYRPLVSSLPHGPSVASGSFHTVGPIAPSGPHLRNGVPASPVDGRDGIFVVDVMPPAPTRHGGWIYCRATGEIRANAPGRAPEHAAWFELRPSPQTSPRLWGPFVAGLSRRPGVLASLAGLILGSLSGAWLSRERVRRRQRRRERVGRPEGWRMRRGTLGVVAGLTLVLAAYGSLVHTRQFVSAPLILVASHVLLMSSLEVRVAAQVAAPEARRRRRARLRAWSGWLPFLPSRAHAP